MDHDLIKYLDRQFDATRQQITASTEQIAALDQKITANTSRIDALSQATAERFDKVEDDIRQTRVLIEDFHDTIKLVAEGLLGVRESLIDQRSDIERQLKEYLHLLRVVMAEPKRRWEQLEHQMETLGLRLDRLEAVAA